MNTRQLICVLGAALGLASPLLADITGRIHLNNGGGWGPSRGHGGFNLSGSHRGSRWSFDFNVGSGWNNGFECDNGPTTWNLRNGGFTTSRWYADRWGWSSWERRYFPYGYATGQVVSAGSGPTDWNLLPGVTPNAAPGTPPAPPPPPPPTELELAAQATANKQHSEARAHLMAHLKDKPDDVEASRRLAMCLIEGKEIDTGLAMLRDLYVADPTLAERPYDGPSAGQDAGRLRDMVTKITPCAHKVKSPSAWLGVVIAMQAEGRGTLALKMLARAKDAGLERSVVERFEAALTPPLPKPKQAKNPPGTSAPALPTVPATTPALPPVPGPAQADPAAVPPPAATPTTSPEAPAK
jgi:hypothetical protein